MLPACTVFRMSLSSEADASPVVAFTRATVATGPFVPSNQIVDSGLPPASFARSRTILEEPIS